MKDVEKTTLRAFLIALYQQKSVADLPGYVLTTLNEVSRDIDNQVEKLHQLAIDTPSLSKPYREARQWFAPQAAERGMGKKWLADPSDDQPDTEQLNVAREVVTKISKLDGDTAAKIFSDPDPVQKIQNHTKSEQQS